MATVSLLLLVMLAVGAVVLFWFIGGYNKLVRLKALVDEAWSGIDVQLKRRHDLIPNLVAVVKQYSIHEKSVLEEVTKMRTASMSATGVTQKADAENQLTGALKTLFAVSENYPDLKANENFLSLQKELSALEHEIQLARRYYNGATRNYNIAVTSFPTTIIASFTGFTKCDYFQIDESERETPKVQF